MKIIIDNTEDVRIVERAGLAGFISALNAEFKAQGKLIEHFECNGKIVSFLSASQNHDLINDGDELKIFTKQSSRVVRDAVEFSKLQLPKLIEALQTISTLARQDKVNDALKSYSSILPFFQMLIMGLISINAWSKQTNFDQEVFNGVLGELNDSLTRNDYVSFCDILEYRLIPELNKINVVLQNIPIE